MCRTVLRIILMRRIILPLPKVRIIRVPLLGGFIGRERVKKYIIRTILIRNIGVCYLEEQRFGIRGRNKVDSIRGTAPVSSEDKNFYIINLLMILVENLLVLKLVFQYLLMLKVAPHQ